MAKQYAVVRNEKRTEEDIEDYRANAYGPYTLTQAQKVLDRVEQCNCGQCRFRGTYRIDFLELRIEKP